MMKAEGILSTSKLHRQPTSFHREPKFNNKTTGEIHYSEFESQPSQGPLTMWLNHEKKKIIHHGELSKMARARARARSPLNLPMIYNARTGPADHLN